MKSLKIKLGRICSLLLIAAVAGTSCSEDFLKPKPLSAFMPENTYTNKAAMTSLLNSLRAYIRAEYTASNVIYYSTELWFSDICVRGNNIPENGLYDIDRLLSPYGGAVGSVNNSFIWARAYAQIKTVNIILSRQTQVQYDTEADKNEILAEAYFHQAYWYYRLVNHYGDVPFIDEELTSPKVDFYSHSRRSILDKLVENMEFAVRHLPESVEAGEVSRAAGNHMLTKLYLAVGRFDDAVRTATEVIERSGLALMKERFGTQHDIEYMGTTYEGNVLWDLFAKENVSIPTNTEGIFILPDRFEFRGMGASANGSYRTANFTPQWQAIPGMMTMGYPLWNYLYFGEGRIRPTPHTAYELWNGCGEDLRHAWPNWYPMDSLFYNNPTLDSYRQPTQIQNSVDSMRNWFPVQRYKVFVPDELRNPDNDRPQGGYTDIYVFRLAETYLMRAEAYWWLNQPGNAASDINAIRERAKAPLITAADVTIDYILDERTRELYTEELRKCELNRISFCMAEQGRDGYGTSNMHQKNFYYDRVMRRNSFYAPEASVEQALIRFAPYHYLYPIPQTAIDANGEGHINQNMGYAGSENNIPPLELD